MQLKASFTVLQNLKKNSPKEIGETGTRKLPINLQYPDFARSRTSSLQCSRLISFAAALEAKNKLRVRKQASRRPRNRATARAHKVSKLYRATLIYLKYKLFCATNRDISLELFVVSQRVLSRDKRRVLYSLLQSLPN